jgi:hypothetical protein
MHIPHVLFQIAILIIFVISAYRSISSLTAKDLVNCLFYAAVAIVAFVYLF